MPFVQGLHVRDLGTGDPPIVVLHGGWGYGFYPFDDAIAGIPRRFVIPDRTGYGQSPPRTSLPPRFHAIYARRPKRCSMRSRSNAVFYGATATAR